MAVCKESRIRRRLAGLRLRAYRDPSAGVQGCSGGDGGVQGVKDTEAGCKAPVAGGQGCSDQDVDAVQNGVEVGPAGQRCGRVGQDSFIALIGETWGWGTG